ncbi:MAG: hypothetical protein R2882_10420 [Gemmatimonadales bacterium]
MIRAVERRGLLRGERAGVKTGIINCSLRHYDPAVSLVPAEHSVAMAAKVWWRSIWRAESLGRMPGLHGAAFDVARDGGLLGITVHASRRGGWPPSIAEAIDRCHA